MVQLQGTKGDQGAKRINGYATSFALGLTAPTPLYKVTFRASGLGNTLISVGASTEAKFLASTPGGLKLGHTDNNGNPSAVNYPSAIAVSVTGTSNGKGDLNNDSHVDASDVPSFVNVLLCIDIDPGRRARSDMNCDGTADGLDIQPFVDLLLAP